MSSLTRAQFNALVIILTSYLLILLDISIVITGLPEIQKDLGFTQIGLSWVQNAYTLCFGGLLMLGARAGDLLGRKRMFILGVAGFTLSSLAIGLAMSTSWLVIMRAVQGASASILAPSTLALLSVYFKDGEERVKALSYYSATAGIGATLGLVLGGIFAGWLSWRIGFFVNVPFGIIIMIAATRLLEETETHAGKFDLLGALTSSAGMGLLIYGIISAGEKGWGDLSTLICLVSAVLLLMVFIRHEKSAPQPLLPLRLFASRERVTAYLARMMFLGAMVSFFFFSTQFMQNVLGYTPVQAGIGFVPMTVSTFVASFWVPKLTAKWGNKVMAIVALMTTLLGMLMLTRLTAESDYFYWLLAAMLLVGLGNGSTLSPLTVSGVAGVEPRDAGAASGVVNVAHQMGGTLGLSILVVVYASAQTDQVQGVELYAQQITTGFIGCSVFLALGAVIMMLARPKVKQQVLQESEEQMV